MHPGPTGASGLVDAALGDGAGLAGIRSRFRAENHIAEGAVVANVPRRGGQQVQLRPRRRCAAVQGVSGAADGRRQRRLHIAVADALPAGFVVHLLQVGAVAQPPCLRQPLGLALLGVLIVQEPRDFPPAVQPLVQFDGVRRGAAGHAQQLRGVGLAADRLRMQEDGDDRLLRLTAVPQRRKLALYLSGFRQLALQQPRPIRGPTGTAGIRHIGQFLHRVRSRRLAGRGQQGRRANQGARIPLLRFAQGGGQGAQNASGALEALQLGPAAVEHIGQVWMEREALQKAGFRLRSILGRGFIQLG